MPNPKMGMIIIIIMGASTKLRWFIWHLKQTGKGKKSSCAGKSRDAKLQRNAKYGAKETGMGQKGILHVRMKEGGSLRRSDREENDRMKREMGSPAGKQCETCVR